MGVLLLALGCQKDDDLNTKEQQTRLAKPVISATKVNTEDISQNKILSDRISKLRARLGKRKTKGGTFNKTIDVSQYDFIIDTDQGIEIVNQDSTCHTFTFPAIRTVDTDTLENLLLSLQEDGTYKAMLVTYELNGQERDDIRNQINVDLTNKINVYNLEDDAFVDNIFGKDLQPGDCVGMLMCSLEDVDGHVASELCISINLGLYFNNDMCNSTGGGSTGGGPTGIPGGNNPSPSNGDQTSQGGGGTSNQNPTLPVIPVRPYWKKIIDCIPDVMKIPNATAWLQDLTNKRQAGQMLQYLDDNGCSEEASEFSEMAVKAWLEDGEVDFPNRVIKDSSFENSETGCIHDELTNDSQGNFYKSMLSSFSENDFEVLRFEIAETIDGDWGIAVGNEMNNNEFGFDFYNITVSNQIESTSNVAQMVTLSHELIHVFLFNSLDNLGIIYYDPEGNPLFDTTQCNNFQANVNINNLSIQDRWLALICAYNNNPDPNDWTHDLFATSNFIVNSYRSELQNLVRNFHDWDSENQNLKALLQTKFGSLWKDQASEYLSWKGLEKTSDFANWAQNNNLLTSTDLNGDIIYPDYSIVIDAIKFLGKSNCQD